MELAADASVLVAELLRARGVNLISNPALSLNLSAHAWSEVRHELPRRVAAGELRGRFSSHEAAIALRDALALVERFVVVGPESTYVQWQSIARRRVPRDENDWPTVALALTLESGIWTADADFLGCGVPTWTTETLLLHLGV
ncbi:MAG: PIN domain-containing protein [Chloroflexota bacterium]